MAEWRRGRLDVVPGIEILSTCEPQRRSVHAERLSENLWELIVHRGEVTDADLRFQVDQCGVWITIATHADRPVVVRRAGWVELRGQRSDDQLQRWDRVGLGPGDAMVVPIASAVDEADVLESLLAQHQCTVDELSQRLPAREHLVVRVPPFEAVDGARWASVATGLPATAFAAPLHRPGSPEAELWKRRPAPPMEARVGLRPVTEDVPRARGLLRRLVASWRMSFLLDGVLELLATELLTDAVLHARSGIVAVIRYDGSSIRFEVRDDSAATPEGRPERALLDRGRSLQLVDSLAARWGIEPRAGDEVTWFEVDVEGQQAHDAGVIAAHGALQVARAIEASARMVLSAPPADVPAALRLVSRRCELLSALLLDLVQGAAASGGPP